MNPYQPYAPPAAPMGPPVPAYAGSGQAGVSEHALEMLRQTRPWVIFLGIVSFVLAAFLALFCLLIFIGLAVQPSNPGGAMAVIVALSNVPMIGVCIYPGVKLVKYGAAIGRLMETRATSDLDDALAQQKSMWKFSGIATIVMIVLYLAAFVAMMVAFTSLVAKGAPGLFT
jgi:hypothetical protein